MDLLITEEQLNQASEDITNNGKHPHSSLSAQYRDSSIYVEVLTEIDAIFLDLRQRRGSLTELLKEANSRELKYQTSFIRQFAILCVRTLRKIVRDPRGIVGQFFITILMSVIIGIVYFDLDRGPGGLQNRVGVMFFLLVNMVFGNLNAITVFLEERQIFRHETANGYYRVSGISALIVSNMHGLFE